MDALVRCKGVVVGKGRANKYAIKLSIVSMSVLSNKIIWGQVFTKHIRKKYSDNEAIFCCCSEKNMGIKSMSILMAK